MSKQIISEEFKRIRVLASLINENQLNENMRLFDLKDENNESTELYKINNFTTVEDVINKLNQYLGIEVEDESDSLYTDDSGTDYNYVHVAGDGNCHFVKSLGEFSDGYQTEEEWGVSTEEPLN